MVLSKLFAGKLGLKLCHAECYELSHTWNPNCFLAIYDALLPGTIFTLKTYGILYLIKSLVDTRGHINKIEWKNLFYKTIRSSLFIISTCVLFLSWSCAFRRLIGFVTWPTISFLNGFVTCLVTIWIESKQRRVMLLPYLLNLTSEALFRQAESRKLLRHIKFGESILFGFSTGVIYLIIGIKNVCLSMPSVCEQYSKMSKSKLFLQKLLKYSHGVLPENGGINEVKRTLKISSRNFLASFILLQLYNLFKQQNNFKSYSLLKFPLFLASMPLFFQFFTSILYKFKFFKQKYNIRQALSIASSSFLSMAIFWKNNTLALYTFWKMIELIYYWLICSHYLPIIPFGDAFLFCSVSSYLLGLAVLEPHLLRSNYYKFLCSATGNKLQLFNRPLFDYFFGFNSAKLYKNFWPKLDTNLLTINPSLYCSKPQYFYIF